MEAQVDELCQVSADTGRDFATYLGAVVEIELPQLAKESYFLRYATAQLFVVSQEQPAQCLEASDVWRNGSVQIVVSELQPNDAIFMVDGGTKPKQSYF